ncbi:Cytochrome b-c1 complex subunit 6 mitochondrial, partial [Taenia solium]
SGLMSTSDTVVDPIHELRQRCRETKSCAKFVKLLEACSDRQPNTKESCEEELIDLIQCVDKCVGPKLFAVLK